VERITVPSIVTSCPIQRRRVPDTVATPSVKGTMTRSFTGFQAIRR
jgi:hypothetical protein